MKMLKMKTVARAWALAALWLLPLAASGEAAGVEGSMRVAREGELPSGYFAMAAGYLPGDTISVTVESTGSSLQVLNVGSLDESEGLTMLLSKEAAAVLGITGAATADVKLSNRSGYFDETALGYCTVKGSFTTPSKATGAPSVAAADAVAVGTEERVSVVDTETSGKVPEPMVAATPVVVMAPEPEKPVESELVLVEAPGPLSPSSIARAVNSASPSKEELVVLAPPAAETTVAPKSPVYERVEADELSAVSTTAPKPKTAKKAAKREPVEELVLVEVPRTAKAPAATVKAPLPPMEEPVAVFDEPEPLPPEELVAVVDEPAPLPLEEPVAVVDEPASPLPEAVSAPKEELFVPEVLADVEVETEEVEEDFSEVVVVYDESESLLALAAPVSEPVEAELPREEKVIVTAAPELVVVEEEPVVAAAVAAPPASPAPEEGAYSPIILVPAASSRPPVSTRPKSADRVAPPPSPAAPEPATAPVAMPAPVVAAAADPDPVEEQREVPVEITPVVVAPAPAPVAPAEPKAAPAVAAAPELSSPVPVAASENVKPPVASVSPEFAARVVADENALQKDCYYIQIATLGSQKNIDSTLQKYSKYPIVLVPASDPALHKVLVGPLSVDEYGAVLSKFKDFGYKDAFVKKR